MAFSLFRIFLSKSKMHGHIAAILLFALSQLAGNALSQTMVAGNKGHDYGDDVISEPASEMQQSKLWWHDGFWWGCMWNPDTNRYEVYRFEKGLPDWQSTGVALDDRDRAKADVLWDGQSLYVLSERYASTGETSTENKSARLYRLQYDFSSKIFQLSPGFPVTINSATSETITLAKDSRGQLWATWVENSTVMVNRSLGDDAVWGTPFPLPVQNSPISDDDISAIVSFGGSQIGILWSNQLDETTYFATHRDGDSDTVWQAREIAFADAAAGPVSDDHLNMKAATDGTVYVAVRTNLTADGSAGIVLLRRQPGGAWSQYVVALENNDHSHPVIMLNNENRRIYVVTRSKETGNSIVYLKSTGMDELNFTEGLGLPLIESQTISNINNPTGTKQGVDRATGMMILADDKDALSYYYRHIDFSEDAPEIFAFSPLAAPAATTVLIQGKNFRGTTKVTFGGLPTNTFVVLSDSLVQAVVPADAVSGTIELTTAIEQASSAKDFVVTQPPKIASFQPADGPANTVVTLTGEHYSNASSVTFNGLPAASFAVESDRQLRAVVPFNASTGPIAVGNSDGIGQSARPFIVTRVPVIDSFQPAIAKTGDQVVIRGKNFFGARQVTFADTLANFSVKSDSEIRATVPASAKNGLIRVENSAGFAISVGHFSVLNRLSIGIDGQGEVELLPPGGVYPQGTLVKLIAKPGSGWEFSDWDGDHDGTSSIDSVRVDADKSIIADFELIPKHTISVAVKGAGTVRLQPPNGPYLRGSLVKLSAVPEPGFVFSGYRGDFRGWMLEEDLLITDDHNFTAHFSPERTPLFPEGIFSSSAEIAKLPTRGLLWENLKSNADVPIGRPNVSDQDDPVNVVVLAKALVYARTGDEFYRTQVIDACMAAIGSEHNGRTLAIGRELLAYVLAADLVGLPARNDVVFRGWLADVLTQPFDGSTLRSDHERRPNNWGTNIGATRAAIARYLDDTTELERIANVFRGWLGDRQAYAGFEFGELWWQADSLAPVAINPAGAKIGGFPVDGVLPDDQRRAGPFTWPPPQENYVYGALQGALMTAIILYRAGYDDLWDWQDRALYRAFEWLYRTANYPAEGDDQWVTHIINHYYQADFEAHYPANPGKNAGYTDWLYGGEYALNYSDRGDGSVDAHAIGLDADGHMRVQLEAVPDSGSNFSGWIGGKPSTANPDTVLLDEHKEVIAVLKADNEAALFLDIIGSGNVKKSPDRSAFEVNSEVTLQALPNPGYRFQGWSGDLSGGSNPAQIVLSADKYVGALFVPDGQPGEINHVRSELKSALNGMVLETTEKMSGQKDVLYLAAVARRPGTIVTNVSGLGLQWLPVKAQCDGNAAIEIEVWMALGAALDDTPVQVRFSSPPKFAELIVSQYTGVDVQIPFVNVVTANAAGLDGNCENGQAQPGYAIEMPSVQPKSMLYHAVVAHRHRQVPASNLTPRAQVADGSGGYGFSLAVQDIAAANGGAISIAGEFEKATTWASITLELRAETPANNAPASDPAIEAAETKKIKEPVAPTVLQMQPIYPNPFNAGAKIVYALPEAAHVRIVVYNILGQEVRELLNAPQRPGHKHMLWDGRDQNGRAVSSGMYLIALHIDGEQRLLRRAVLQK